MIKITQSGDFKNTEKFLRNAKNTNLRSLLEHYGKIGVDALQAATPINTGTTADSWNYSIEVTRKSVSLEWTNSNESEGIPIVILIQYGHMANGAYVQGRDFINPVVQPIFDEIAENLWKEVTS